MSQFHFISTDIFPQTLFFRMVWNWHSRYNDLVLWYTNIPVLPLKTMHKSGNVNASCHKGGNVNTSCISPYWSPFDSCGYCTSRDTSINIEGIIIYGFAHDTHDRQNILSHFIQILGWSGCRISSSNVFYVILLSLSVLVLWPVGETCHLLLFFCFCVMS